MDSWLVQIGVGGVFAIVVLREVFNFLKSYKNHRDCKKQENNPGQASTTNFVSRTEFEQHKSSVQYKDTCGEIVKRIENALKSQEKNIDKQFGEIKGGIKDIKESLK